MEKTLHNPETLTEFDAAAYLQSIRAARTELEESDYDGRRESSKGRVEGLAYIRDLQTLAELTLLEDPDALSSYNPNSIDEDTEAAIRQVYAEYYARRFKWMASQSQHLKHAGMLEIGFTDLDPEQQSAFMAQLQAEFDEFNANLVGGGTLTQRKIRKNSVHLNHPDIFAQIELECEYLNQAAIVKIVGDHPENAIDHAKHVDTTVASIIASSDSDTPVTRVVRHAMRGGQTDSEEIKSLKSQDKYSVEELLELYFNHCIEIGEWVGFRDIDQATDMPSQSVYQRKWNIEDLREEVQAWALLNGYGAHELSAIALPEASQRFTDTELLELYIKHIVQEGAPLTSVDIDAIDDLPSARTYFMRFASFDNLHQRAREHAQMSGYSRSELEALEALAPKPRRHHTETELIRLYLALSLKLGRWATPTDIEEADELPSRNTLYRRLGGKQRIIRLAHESAQQYLDGIDDLEGKNEPDFDQILLAFGNQVLRSADKNRRQATPVARPRPATKKAASKPKQELSAEPPPASPPKPVRSGRRVNRKLVVAPSAEALAAWNPKDPSWQVLAECLGFEIDLFYPRANEEPNPEIVSACNNCPVQRQCLVHALYTEAKGYWGGTRESQRARMREQLGIKEPSSKLGRLAIESESPDTS